MAGDLGLDEVGGGFGGVDADEGIFLGAEIELVLIEEIFAEIDLVERVDLGNGLRDGEVGGAAALHLVERGIHRADLRAEAVLLGDAAFEAGDIQTDDIEASGGESFGEGGEQSNAVAAVVTIQARSSSWWVVSLSTSSRGTGLGGGCSAGGFSRLPEDESSKDFSWLGESGSIRDGLKPAMGIPAHQA